MICNGSTKLMGLLGKGIHFSLSPLIHNTSAQLLGQNTCYLPLEVDPAHHAGFLAAAYSAGAIGFNVTVPYKELIAQLCAAPAAALTSVNTLYRGPSTWLAASTDGEGFVSGLGRMGVDLNTLQHVVFLGAGGAVQALISHLASLAFSGQLSVLRRSSAKDQQLRQLMPGGRITCYDWDPAVFAQVQQQCGAGTLVVQGTSAPLHGDDLKVFAENLQPGAAAVVDLSYGHRSALLHAARQHSILHQDGLPMLIEQARAAQLLWWQEAAPYEFLEQTLLSHGHA